MNKNYTVLQDGLFSIKIEYTPNIWGRIKIFWWNLILFPIVKITYHQSHEQ